MRSVKVYELVACRVAGQVVSRSGSKLFRPELEVFAQDIVADARSGRLSEVSSLRNRSVFSAGETSSGISYAGVPGRGEYLKI